MEAKSPAVSTNSEEDTTRLIRVCAEACGVGNEIVEKICLASEEQKHRMDHHVKSGSYMMQMVLHYEGDLNQTFLLRVLSAMCFKNHVLRSRLIKHEGQVYQVVLRESIAFQQAEIDLHGFLAQNSRRRMNYGTPLFRYAFIREPHGEAFFVWTDLGAYFKLPPRPPYGKYARWLESYEYEAGLLGPGGTSTAATMKTKKLLHLPKVEDIDISLPTMGHAAWALTIAKCLTQEHPPLISEDISFISVVSARNSNVPGIRHMMGPISARVPLRIHFFPNLSIENLMRDIETQLLSMVGFEHCAMSCFQDMPKQAVFSWNPRDSDVFSKRIVCHDKEAAPAVLDYREDLSVPFAHDYGLMFEVYEHGEHITIHATWDQELVSADFISRLLEEFGSLLVSIIRTRGATVAELLSENRVGQSEQVANSDHHRAGLPPQQLLR
ncbi:MAG: hypothetical protein Q9161_002824 [Pseudevernia consocians]